MTFVIKVIPIVLAFLLIFNSGLVFAQNQQSPSGQIQEVTTDRLAGQIIKVENGTITVNTRDGVKQVNVPNNVSVTKNGNSVSTKELQAGDGVVVTRSTNGEVLSIDALSSTALDVSKWILPIGLGVIVLAILALLAWARMRKDYIKTG